VSNKINEKLGLKPSGKRSMMKLPVDREMRNRLTAAVCPSCGRRGANQSRVVEGGAWCTWCSHTWTLPERRADD
jgi:hypothetical protein